MLSSSASGTISLIFGERPSVRFPKPDVPHLRQRSDGACQPFANGQHAGDRRRADGAEADQKDAEFAFGWSDFNVFHSRQLYHLSYRVSC